MSKFRVDGVDAKPHSALANEGAPCHAKITYSSETRVFRGGAQTVNKVHV